MPSRRKRLRCGNRSWSSSGIQSRARSWSLMISTTFGRSRTFEQLPSQNLADLVARKALDGGEAYGDLPRREVCPAMLLERGFVHCRAAVGHHERDRHLAESVVRSRDDRRLTHPGGALENALHL